MSLSLTMSKPSITIIIPNFNGETILRRHLGKIVASTRPYPLVVIDDNSTDNSVEYIKSAFPEITVLVTNKNCGFSSTVNRGVKHVSSDLFVLLNTDVIPYKGFLDQVVPKFKDDRLFAVGLLDESIEGNQIILRGRGLLYWRNGMLLHRAADTSHNDTSWVSCGSGVFRRSVWVELGGLDELYNPFYWEDIDLSYRAQKAGYSVRFEPRSKVIHQHEIGSIKSAFTPEYIEMIAYRNQFITIWKNITDKALLIDHLVKLPITLIKALWHQDMSLWKGFFHALVLLPVIVKKRRYTDVNVLDREILTSIK